MKKSDLIVETFNLLHQSCCRSKKSRASGGGEEKCIDKASVECVIDAALTALAEGLKTDGSVQLIGFGTFSVTRRAARQGVNPRTGKKIPIAASKSIRFKAGSKLKAVVKK